MSTNDELAKEMEAERERREAEVNKPLKVSRSQVKEARFVWMAGVVLIDILTAYLIWNITDFIPYALIWLFGGAGGLLYSERLKERVGNNVEQKGIGDRGVIASALLVAAMALFVGTVWVMRLNLPWINAVMEITAVALFLFHVWQSYRFHSVDDETVAANEEARSEEAVAAELRAIHRAARIVDGKKKKSGLKDLYRKDHGAALDQALITLGLDVAQAGTVSAPKPQPPQQPNTPPAPQHTLDELTQKSGLSKDQLRSKYADQQAFMNFASGQFDYVSNGNMRRMHGELMNGQKSADPHTRQP